MLIAYDGTNYQGWQSQKSRNTIQDKITEKLDILTCEKITLLGQGRTDSGVHALGQTANFLTKTKMDIDEIKRALNRLLPEDIMIIEAREVNTDFSARYDATSRTYEYRILNKVEKDPFSRDFVWHVPYKLDIEKMRIAAGYLIGKHDFSSYRASLCSAKNPVRELISLDIKEEGKLLLLTFKANAFLHNMVRNIVGLLVEIGVGKFPPEYAREVLELKDITKKTFKNWTKAPAKGLFLLEVKYGS
ncbi:tRNA pseudouridine(38-40) synthase TruA [bacterium]|nr:tRNA pseudouridine(38-40) synthase TruA [bacterium]